MDMEKLSISSENVKKYFNKNKWNNIEIYNK